MSGPDERASAGALQVRPLKVLYSFPHALGSPGIGTTAWSQVAELLRAGHRVTVAAPSIARPLPLPARVVRTLVVGRIRIPHRALGRDRALRYHDRRAALMLARGRFDVVHTWPLGSLRTLAVASKLGIAGVREAPNTHTEYAYEVVAREMRAVGLELARDNSHRHDERRLARERLEWEAATALLAPSEPVARSFRERGYPSARILRHQYGYDPDRVQASTPPDARPFTALFMGRCEPRKGLHHGLRAWLASDASRNGRFLICGSFAPGYREQLQPLLSHPSVEVRGFLQDVAAAYAQADVLVLPTVEEGSALVTYEAQAAGCVLLVSEAAGAVMEDGTHGFMHKPGDRAALQKHLDALSSDAQLLSGMRANVLSHAPQLTWAAAGVALEAAYRDAIRMAGVRTASSAGRGAR